MMSDLPTSQSLTDILMKWAEQKPTQTACAFIDDRENEVQMTYSELVEDAQQIAATINQAGIKPFDRVVLIIDPGLELIKVFFGCLFAKTTAVLVQPPLNKKLLEKTHRIIHNCEPTLIITPGKLAQRFEELFDSGEYLATYKPAQLIEYESLWQNPSKYIPVQSSGDDVALLQYTSGSTNYPKGVMITHGNLVDNLEKIKNAFHMHDQSVMFSWLPPYHDMGLMGGILAPIYTGYPTYLTTPFAFLKKPLLWLKAISTHQVTISGAPNFAYDYCVKKIKDDKKSELDLSSWEVAFNGAEPVHHHTMQHFYDAFKACGFRKEAFYPCYGLAESTLLAASGIPLKPYQSLNIKKTELQTNRVEIMPEQSVHTYQLVSSGFLHHETLIVNPDTLEPCESDTIGEIWLRSESIAKGYWNQPDETKEIFIQTMPGETNELPFLRTGDLGFIHDNELYVTGRIKDLIILHGKNHYPQDIEATLKYCTHHELFGLSAAFVKTENNEYLLSVVCELMNQRLGHEELDNLCNHLFRLIYHEHTLEIHEMVFIRRNAMPQTTSGKVKRKACRMLLANDELPVLHHWRLDKS